LRTSSRIYFSAISISSAVGITVSSSKRLQNKFKYECGHYLNMQLSKSLPFFRLTTATGIQAKPFASHKGFQWALVCFPIVKVFMEFVYKKAFIIK
jgi:hypothetical protein